MSIVENFKRALTAVTGIGAPSEEEARAAVRKGKPRTIMFKDDGAIPNNPALPLVVFKNAVRLDGAFDAAAVFETLFAANGWRDSWRNGIYDYVHYHSRVHEVLGVARGSARVRFGGERGEEIDIKAGDVAILPAGTGHHCLSASEDFLVVGAYPPAGTYDECRGAPEEHARALETIPNVPLPKADPIHGADGPLLEVWTRKRATSAPKRRASAKTAPARRHPAKTPKRAGTAKTAAARRKRKG
jgi:uncharacterized protein YjlB